MMMYAMCVCDVRGAALSHDGISEVSLRSVGLLLLLLRSTIDDEEAAPRCLRLTYNAITEPPAPAHCGHVTQLSWLPRAVTKH